MHPTASWAIMVFKMILRSLSLWCSAFGLGLALGCATPPAKVPSSPARAATPEALQPGAASTLEAAARDGMRPISERQRAVEGLADVSGDAADAAVNGLVQDESMEVALRVTALQSLAKRRGPAALSALRPYLSHVQVPLRSAAAQALGTVGGEEARHALEERLDTEDNVGVREALQQSMTRLQP